MKKTLKIEVTKRTKGIVTFRIAEQSHREDLFGVDDKRFAASNGIDLFSVYLPEWEKPCMRLYVRGLNPRHDDNKITVTAAEFQRIEAAVAEYNAFEFEE